MSQDLTPLDALPDSPHHGFQGDRGEPVRAPRVPVSLTIAISREAGSRGTSVAQRVGEILGWQVYTQELLEHATHDERVRQDLLDGLSPDMAAWVDGQVARSPLQDNPARMPATLELLRLILALGAQGEVVLIGRGSGLILPRPSTRHVRLIAPLPDRIAYMSQWQRLTDDEAAEVVRARDRRRDNFIETHFHRSPGDPHQYDLVLNTSFLGEELCADLIVRSARGKLATLLAPPGARGRVPADFHDG